MDWSFLEYVGDYLKKYPKHNDTIGALVYALGIDATKELCKQALEENKRIIVKTNDAPDWIDVKLK